MTIHCSLTIRCVGAGRRETRHRHVGTAIRAGADVSVTVRMDPAVKAAITLIPADAWTTIEYPNAVRDETTGQWVSRGPVRESHHRHQASGRHEVRVIE